MNQIIALERADWRTYVLPEEVKEEISSFYHMLYQSQGYKLMNELLDCVDPRVTEGMNELLEKDYVAEVKKTLLEMASSKAPGVDGFTACFYQRH